MIYFSRYEASTWGSAYIEPEHLLLGILREDKVLARRFGLRGAGLGSVDPVRREIEAIVPSLKLKTTRIDIPLSPISKRIMERATVAAEVFKDKHVRAKHWFYAILHEKTPVTAQIMSHYNVSIDSIRNWVRRPPSFQETPVASPITVHGGAGIDDALGNVEGANGVMSIDHLISMMVRLHRTRIEAELARQDKPSHPKPAAPQAGIADSTGPC
jgi:hypothetical protein